jgi:hypothetical protein
MLGCHNWQVNEDRLLLQLSVLRFRSDENRNVRVGVFPKREEILISRLGLGGVALHGIGSADLEMGQFYFLDLVTAVPIVEERRV